MLCCECFHHKRRSSSVEDSSSCRSSEIERGIVTSTQPQENGSIFKFLTSKGWCRKQLRKAGRGMSMTKVERVIKATLLIQRWYRRYLARNEMKRRYTWTIFQNIEYAGEQENMQLYNFFNALLIHMPEAAKRLTEHDDLSTSSADSADENYVDESDDSLDDVGIEAPEKTYKGPHLTFPLKRADLDLLINLFRKKKYKLHAKYVAGILKEAAKKLRRMENINRASTAISRSVTVVGDLHGKLDDLLVILYKNGLPSVDNCYVFNGDFVDRGKKGLEVLLILLVCLLIYPGGVYLNRGNHEDAVMNLRYGFTREVHQKYKHNAERLLKLIDQVFRHLPLATLINNKIFVVHGGISDTTDLDLLNSVRRSKYVSILRPPINAESISSGNDAVNKSEWKQLFDILWSDPCINDGCSPNKLRGAGTVFGPDVTNKFLQRYNLTNIVRSHECKSDGYEMIHGGNVITVFSASNYYEIGSNRGAYIKFGANSDRYFVQFTAAASKTRKLTFKQQVDNVEKSAIRELCEKLREQKVQLAAEFKQRDPQNTGLISTLAWSESLETVTNYKLPWRLLREKMAVMNESNEIIYEETLRIIDSDISFQSSGGSSVTETLYSNRASLEAIFRIIDKDNSGQISIDEFKEACHILAAYLPHYTMDQLLENCRMMDMNKDSLVDLNEFLEAFRLCQTVGKPAVTDNTSNLDNLADSQSAVTVQKLVDKELEEMCERSAELDILDQYEIKETCETMNKRGLLKRSSSRKSIISIESLGETTDSTELQKLVPDNEQSERGNSSK